MGIDQPIDITAGQRKVILALLDKHLPNTTAWVYGSRAKGTARPQSDLDMVVFTKPEQSDQVIELREAFEESDLPFRVDLFVWDALPENFRPQVTAEHVVLLQKEKKRERANGWKNVTLGDYIDVNDATYSRRDAWHQVNYLETGGICENRISEIKRLIFGRDKIPSRARRKVQPGDIVYSKVRPDQRHYGLLKKPPGNLLVSRGFAVIRGKKELACTEFIYWFLSQNHIVEQLQTIAEHSTSAYPSIKPNDIEALKVTLPPLEEQRAIAHILGTLDDKIELNLRLNKTLEAMAQALFKSWFVDFDPVRAKAALKGNALSNVSRDSKLVTHDQTAPALHDSHNATGIGATKEKNWTSERARAYLNKLGTSVAALFPDSFSDSELGKIPAEWKVRSIKDLLELAYGKSLKASNRHGGVVPVYGSNGQIGWHNRKLVDGPGIVVGRKGNPGRVTWVFTDFYPIDTTFYVVPKNGKQDIQFLFYALKSQDLPSIAADSAVPGLNRKLAYMNKQAIPTNELIDQFNKITTPIFARSHRLDVESRILVAAREALLPKLLSGTIRTSSSCMEVNQRHR